MPDYLRRSARVLLVDAAGSVLLLRFLRSTDDPGAGDLWLTPGGGVEAGEDLATAAARELAEEVGLHVDPQQLRHVASSSGHARFDAVEGLTRNDFFLHRVDGHDVDTSGHTELERRFFTGHRWWGVDDLRRTTEAVYPLGLADLLDDVLAGRDPQDVVLPW